MLFSSHIILTLSPDWPWPLGAGVSFINETDSQFIYPNLLILDLQNKLYPGLISPGRKLEFGTAKRG